MSFYVSTATFLLLHCDEWDRVVALPRHKFVTGATLLQLWIDQPWMYKSIDGLYIYGPTKVLWETNLYDIEVLLIRNSMQVI